MTVENALSVLGLLGIGGILGTWLQIVLERRNSALLQKQEFKETRYKCIIMLMYTALDYEKRGSGLIKFGRNFSSKDDVLDELQAEWHNAILFALEEALTAIHAFIREPTVKLFKQAALAMRKDLWGGKSSKVLAYLEF
jgi:hypothetical protein